jgi:alpha-N-arabinofuranosidase
VSIVNSHVSDAIEVPIDLLTVSPKSASLTVLTGKTIQAHNDFDQPDTVCPRVITLKTPDNGLTVTLEPASVNVLQIKI